MTKAKFSDQYGNMGHFDTALAKDVKLQSGARTWDMISYASQLPKKFRYHGN